MTGSGLDLQGQIWYTPQGIGRWRVAIRLVGVGWYIGLCIFLGVWGGLWLDSRLNTTPILIIAGLIIGVAVAIYGVYRMLLPTMGNRRDKESN